MEQHAESLLLRTIKAAKSCQGGLWQHAGLNAVGRRGKTRES